MRAWPLFGYQRRFAFNSPEILQYLEFRTSSLLEGKSMPAPSSLIHCALWYEAHL